MTNSSGELSQAFRTNTVAGTYTVSASASSVSTPALFSPLTNTAGAPSSIEMTSGSGQSATVSNGTTQFANPLVVTVKDSFNNLVPGATVSFTAPGSGASGI